jgi:hypothetical protein
MRIAEPTEWVVYRAAVIGKLGGHNATCSQQEWETMERSQAGMHTLIREKIPSESQAEQLARSLQTLPPAPKPARKPVARPARVAPATLTAAVPETV